MGFNYSNPINYSKSLDNLFDYATGEYRVDGDKILVYFDTTEIEYDVDVEYNDYGECYAVTESGVSGEKYSSIFEDGDYEYINILNAITQF